MRAPERIDTDRLVLQRPTAADVDAIFRTYASDPEVTRYVGFPRHRRVEDTRAFLDISHAHWTKWPAGPYLIRLRASDALVGSTGLAFDTPQRAQTGYVLATAAWGHGYATEALHAMVDVARATGVVRLYAVCHHTHRASARVLEKGGFTLEGRLRRYAEFPNLGSGGLDDVLCFAVVLENLSSTEGEMRS